MQLENYVFTYASLEKGGRFRPMDIYIRDEDTLFLYLGTMLEIVEKATRLDENQRLALVRDFANMLSDYPITINKAHDK